MNKFRNFLLTHPIAFRAWQIALTLIGKCVLFWRRPKLTDADIDRCYQVLYYARFAVIGLGSRRFLTGLFLPRGRHDVEHTAIYIGGGIAVEAVTPRCRAISIRRLLRQYDNVTIVVYPYIDRQAACSSALSCVDRTYDVLFNGGSRKLYCHEYGANVVEAGDIPVKKSGEFYSFDDLADAGEVALEIRR